MSTEVIFRRPVWKIRTRKFSFFIQIIVILVGVAEGVIGYRYEYPTDRLGGLSTAGAGAALVCLGLALVIADDRGKTIRHDFQRMSQWFEQLLTNKESPLVSRVESLRKGVLGHEPSSISSEIRLTRDRIEQTEEFITREQPAILREAVKAEIQQFANRLTEMETNQRDNLQAGLSALEERQTKMFQEQLGSLAERVAQIEKNQQEALQAGLAALEERQTKMIQTELGTFAEQQGTLQSGLSDLEEKQAKVIQEELSSLGTMQSKIIEDQLGPIDERLQKLPSYKELKSVQRELKKLVKRVQKIEAWNK